MTDKINSNSVEDGRGLSRCPAPTCSEFYEMGIPTQEDVYFSEDSMFRHTVKDYRDYDGSYSSEIAYVTADS